MKELILSILTFEFGCFCYAKDRCPSLKTNDNSSPSFNDASCEHVSTQPIFEETIVFDVDMQRNRF